MFQVEAFLQPPIEGVVLQAYGAGNVPANRGDLIDAFKDATSRGVIIVTCTQCSRGTVSNLYQTGKVNVFTFSLILHIYIQIYTFTSHSHKVINFQWAVLTIHLFPLTFFIYKNKYMNFFTVFDVYKQFHWYLSVNETPIKLY